MESQGQPCLKGLPSLALGATANQHVEDVNATLDHKYTIPSNKGNLGHAYYPHTNKLQHNKIISTTRVQQSDNIPNVLLDDDEDDEHDDKTCHSHQDDDKLQGDELESTKPPTEMQQYSIHVDENGRVTTISQGNLTGDLNQLQSNSNNSQNLSLVKDNNNQETSSLPRVAVTIGCHGDNTKEVNSSVDLDGHVSSEQNVADKQHIDSNFNSTSATDMEFSYGDLASKDSVFHAEDSHPVEQGQSSKGKSPMKLDLEHLQLLNAGGPGDYMETLTTMNTTGIQDTTKSDAKNIKMQPTGTLILNTSTNTTKSADIDTIPIQVYPQGQGISLVTSSGILTADISTFSTQVPAILTEGDADDAEHSTNFAEQFQVVTTSSILAGTSHTQTQNNEMLSVMMSPSDLSKSVILTAEQQQAILGEVIGPGVGGAQTLHITIPSIGSSGQQAVIAGQSVEEGLVSGEQDGNDGQVRAIQVHLLSSNQVTVNKGSEGESRVKSCPHSDCGKVCHRASKLKQQMPANAGERPHKCPHEGCEWAFTTAYKLKRHERGHTGERPFMCPYEECGRRFTTAYNLKTHVKAHNRTNTILCQYEGCDKSFPTIHKYRVHERKHQQEDKPFKCEVDGCGKEFSAMGTLTTHLKSHSGERPHGCPVEDCGKRFTKASKLKLHLRTHTGERPFACDAEGCGWSFTSAYKLKRHMRKHTGERPYVCNYEGCHKSFTRSSHLKTHTLVHTGEKPYVCPIDGCNKAFTAGSSLNVHMRKHTGEKPFRCEEDGCNKAYTTASNLRAHQKRHDKTTMIVEGPDDQSLSQDYVTVSTISTASNASSLVDNDSDVTYSGMHTFSSEDFTTDDVTAIPVSVHFPAGSLSAIVTNNGNPLTFSTAGPHDHTDVTDEQKGTVTRVALPVPNMEVDGSHIDVAEFVVRNDNVEPVLQTNVVSKHSDDHMKHDSGFDLSITSIVNQLRSHETSPNGKLSTSDVLASHGGERLVLDSKFVASHSRSLEFRTPVNPEDQFKPPAVIFQEDSNKSGSSDTETETMPQSHTDLPTTNQSLMQITLPQEVIQIHFPQQGSPLPPVPGNNDTPMEIESTSGHHQLQSFESPSLSELQGHKTTLSPYMEQSTEVDEGHVDNYPESTINLQDLR